MELTSDRFAAAFERLLDRPVPLVATVHLFRHPFTDRLKRRLDVDVIRVTSLTRTWPAADQVAATSPRLRVRTGEPLAHGPTAWRDGRRRANPGLVESSLRIFDLTSPYRESISAATLWVLAGLSSFR